LTSSRTRTFEIIEGLLAEVRIKQADPIIHKILKDIGFENLTFVHVSYFYGDEIHRNGVFYFPSDKRSLSG